MFITVLCLLSAWLWELRQKTRDARFEAICKRMKTVTFDDHVHEATYVIEAGNRLRPISTKMNIEEPISIDRILEQW